MFKAASGAVYRGVKAQPGGALQSFNAGLQYSLVPLGAAGSNTPTFTRATTAYQTDFSANLNAVLSGEARFQGARRVGNILSYTEAISNAAWTLGGSTTVSKTATDPNGVANNAWVVVMPSNTDGISQGTGIFPSGAVFVNQVWLRAQSGTPQVYLDTGGNGGTALLTLSTTWTLYSVKSNAGSLTSAYFTLRTDYLTNIPGLTFEMWHPQSENVAGQANQNPSEYVPNTGSADPSTGGIGVRYFNYLNGNTVASNVVTQAQGLPIVAGQSGVSASAPVDALGPMGEIDELAATQYLGVTGTPATQTTASLGTGKYCLWVVGSGSATSSAGTATLTGAGAATAASPNVFTVTGAGTVTVTVAGTVTFFQLEGGGFPTTRIDNAGVAGTTFTRIKDVTQYVSAGNIAATMSGTIQVAPEQTFGTFTGYIFSTYVDANNSTSVLFDGTNLIARKRISGTNHDATIAWTPTANTVAKVGWRFDSANGSDIWLNGTKGTNDSTTTAAQIGTNFQIGADGNSANQDDCMHRSLSVYPTSLADAKMGALTT